MSIYFELQRDYADCQKRLAAVEAERDFQTGKALGWEERTRAAEARVEALSKALQRIADEFPCSIGTSGASKHSEFCARHIARTALAALPERQQKETTNG